MPKRHRVRARARREQAPTAPRVERERPERADGDRRERPRVGRYRGAPLPPGGSRAIGEPSPTLERAAVMERAFVVKDLGRLGKVIVAMLVLLALSGVAVSTLAK